MVVERGPGVASTSTYQSLCSVQLAIVPHVPGKRIVPRPTPVTTKVPDAVAPTVVSLPATARTTDDGPTIGANHCGPLQRSP